MTRYAATPSEAARSWFWGLAPANPFLVLGESRSPFELGAFLTFRPALAGLMPKGDGQPVMVLPGFESGDEYSMPMRGLLRELGFRPHPWKLGINKGLRRGVYSGLKARVAELHARYGEPINLAGWSLGGTFARQIAKSMPHAVRQVITLGSPFAEPLVPRRPVPGYERFAELTKPPPVPTTSIFTRTDGIIDWRTSINEPSEIAENIEVPGSHIGLGFNPFALYVLADRLSQPIGEWSPFDRSGLRRLFFV